MSSLTAPFEYQRSITLSFLGQTVVVFLKTSVDELLSLRFCLFPSSGLCIEYSARRSLTTLPFCHHSKNILCGDLLEMTAGISLYHFIYEYTV